MSTKFFALFALLFLVACQSDSQKTTDEVMTIHDEAMADMAKLNARALSIKAWYDVLPDSDEAALLGDTLLNTILMLRQADDGMGTWMQELADNRDSIDQLSDATAFWQAEKERITAVRNGIDSAVLVADKLLLKAPVAVLKPASDTTTVEHE